MTAKLQTVHVRVNDAATGEPTPCRVQFWGADGTYYAPFGRLTEFETGVGKDVGGNLRLPDGTKWAYTDGTFEIALPPGQVNAEISKGFEYRPFAQTFDVKPGQLSLRLSIERWIDARRKGWYSGDIHAEYLSPHAALLEAAAEDLAVVNLLARETHAEGAPGAIPNILAFSGQKPALEMAGHLVSVNTVNWHKVLGELLLLHCHRVVYPLAFGAPVRPDNWTLADWCDQCHRKGGLVISNEYGGLAELILGKVDACKAVSEIPDGWFIPIRYGELLEAGFRIPLVAGSEKRSNARAIGSFRTYARVQQDEPLTYRAWIEAVRAGRTFITNGPLLYLTVNGQDPGSVVKLDARGQSVHVRAEVHSRSAAGKLIVYLAGLVWFPTREDLSMATDGSPSAMVIEREFPMFCSGYISASYIGQQHQALTSPVYLEVPGGRAPDHVESYRADLRSKLLGELEQKLTWINTQAWFENDQQRERLIAIFLAAKEELARRANE